MAQDKGLSASWLSTNIGDFLRLVGPLPPMTRWRQFGPLVISIPPMSFILALKLVAGRQKDKEDIQSLCLALGVTTRTQAQEILDVYINADTQEQHGVSTTLDTVFSTV